MLADGGGKSEEQEQQEERKYMEKLCRDDSVCCRWLCDDVIPTFRFVSVAGACSFISCCALSYAKRMAK